MRRTSFEDMNCSIAQCLEVVGDWWTLLIVRDALFGVTRFDDFRSRLGIARNVLTQRLEHLVDQGVLTREPYQENPPRHDYKLTEKGRTLWTVVNAMREWGDTWSAPDGPPVEAIHKTCGHKMTVTPTCSHCAAPLTPRDIRPTLGPGARTPDLLPNPAR
ncbi:helix-turn-helix domain-containing protein [Nocardia sp. NPDC005978]|uniref:winged helix-turn-helix transcriptional regulator n=1 Tax=unclassified Nocardia TaxID=2637762 RepID=UPI0033BAE16A